MHLADSVKMATATLVTNRLRSLLTMLGIIIGNASVIAMVGIGQGAQRLAASEFESLGPNVLFVVPGNRGTRRTTTNLPNTLVLEDAEAIAAQAPTVLAVAPQISGRYLITYRNRNTFTQVQGVTPEFLVVRSFDVAQGRFLTQADLERNNRVAILGPDLARRLFDQQNPIGRQVRIRNVSFDVIGITEAKGSFLGTNQDDAVYIPLTTMANRIAGRTSPYGTQVSFISVAARDRDSIRAAQFQITNLLRLRHQIAKGKEDDFGVESQRDALRTVNTVTNGLTILLAATSAISLVVGGIGIMNIMLVSVTERTQEIGLRKAVGASEHDILIQFMIEAVILAVAGGLVGTLVGSGAVILIGMVSPLQTSISPIAVAVAVSVSGGIGLFFGVVPARRAAQLDPIVALRSV
ncbi:ABC transporter permease [Trichothermofontia sichuanensis B231]|uniref:ABC transporter permease n=1 Tax=Trichothermofontia sichuanensis TaxID=3045816 RepID=UPI002245C69D|nr:ABC transporter permease [Trichothermofontia sichuanensis]UZQ55928.1 ABC transporter permease [Trichothermofontia sichuanensis B231]